MFSPTKHDDKELYQELLLTTETLIKFSSREGVMELIEKFAEDIEILDYKIKHHDYTREDAARNRSDRRINDFYKSLET